MCPNVSSSKFPAVAAKNGSAFTLIELLSVMAVIAVMSVALVPALSGIKSGGDINKAAYDLASTMEQARAYAMANNTYVFVGLAERDGVDSTKPGVGQVLIAAMGSKDGTRSFGAANSNLVPLTKLRHIDNLHLQDSLPNSGGMVRPTVQDSYRLGNSSFIAEDTFSAGNFAFTKIIQFDPRGMASPQTSTTLVPQWLEVALVPARGNLVANTDNCAALILDGVTGSTKIYRP